MKQESTRSFYWDNIKGVLMLLTVFAHILFQLQGNSLGINSTVDYIYMFHMPAFVFISGFFGKSERSHSFASIIRLVFLYFICNSLMYFIYDLQSLLEPAYSYWYLVALIAWRLTAHHIAKFKEIMLILLAVSLFAGFYSSINNNFAIARIIGFYPFYMAGYLLCPEKNNALVGMRYMKRGFYGILVLAAAAILSFVSYQYFTYSDSALQMASYQRPLDAFGRICLYIVGFLAIYALRLLSPDRNLPLITMFGRNSLAIFLLHRPFTLIASELIGDLPVWQILSVSLIVTAVICICFGNDVFSGVLNKLASDGAAVFIPGKPEKMNAAKIVSLCVAVWFVVSVVITSYEDFELEMLTSYIKGESVTEDDVLNEGSNSEDIIYPVLSSKQKAEFEDALRITFAGDLILLEDQVKRAYNGSEYDFTEVFTYAEKYISSADLAVGVFEGPMAGEEAGYTSSNYDDGKELYLNFPDSFAQAVKDAGFDLVTTANNHVLDKGADGALRTLDVLDSIGLDHTGSYRNVEEKQKEHIKLIECDGVQIAVLSYTYGSNYISTERLTDGDLSYITSVISGTSGEVFEKLKAGVEQDFKDAKAMEPDLILVLPHIGTQFSNEPDEEQKVWFEIFKENGADIILGDHPHAVEPAVVEEYDGRDVFVAYCPGNFANIYREKQGDTSMLIDVYILRDTKKVIGGSVVPLYTQSRADGNFRALPVYDIMNDEELRQQLSTDDIDRAETACNIITEAVFGQKMPASSITERYYFNKNGFVRSKATGIQLTDEMKDGTLYRAINQADSVCFIGDSVTEGTKNGGCPWYEPIEEFINDKSVYNYSKGGCTVSYMIERTDEIPEAELYVIAVGTNDVRYRDETICAMTADRYVEEIELLCDKLSERSDDAQFILIAPWCSIDGDPFCSLSYSDKTALNEEYAEALEMYCAEKQIGYINANPYIMNELRYTPDSKYLLDHIHPNCGAGVLLYSEAVLSQK